MKLTKLFRTITICIAGFLAFSCNNVFHELIPPADSSIHSFSLQDPETGFSRNAVPYSETITITVPYGTDITALIPVIKTDEKATVIPGTLPYIHKAFPSADIVNLSLQMQLAYNSGDMGSWVLNFIQENRDFTVPKLDIPIDFSEPVVFCVIAGQGNYSLYTVSVVIEEPENPGDPSTPQEPESPQEPEEPEPELPKDILSFTVENQLGTSVITQNTVSFTMDDGADIRGLYPVISVSPGAKVLPLTTDYLLDMFTYDQLISLLTGISTSVKPETYIKSFLEKQNNPEIPNLTHRIDFTQPVTLAVIARDNSIKLYTVTCTVQKDEPALTNLAFTKYNNPGLMKDARVSISGNTVTVEATYPVEYPDYDLIPDVSFYGDKITCTLPDGTETQINPGETKLSFGVTNITNGETVSSLLTVYKNGKTTQYNLNITWQEDKDTIRSITDFRFTKNTNPEIGTLSMASIYNEGDTGYISAVILYEGTSAPYELIPDFYSPGIVTKDNAVQTSGVTKQNYQTSFEYLCTSKNGLYCRLYTVNVTFIKVEPAQSLIKSFSFPKFLNPDLSLDSEGVIDQDSATIYLSVKYKSQNPPEKLTAQFGATGNVLVDNIPQSSGFTEQDFKYTQYYTVISKNEISTATKTYKIQVVFTRDEDSDCALVSFGFLKQDNPTMDKDIEATITERSGSVYALLPKGTDFAGTPLIPVFETKGTLTINGSPIQSGTTPVNFGEEVKLTVTSKNGLFTKEYTVLLQESGAVIYVDLRACGRNNGTSWEDAFISFDRAIEAANAIPADSVIEIYLTENDTPYTYDSDAYPLERANLIIRGGFTGNETTPEERIMRGAEDPIPLFNSQIIGTGNTFFLYGDGEKKTGELLVLDSLAINHGKCKGFIGIIFDSKDTTQLKLDIQNCHIKDDGTYDRKLEFLYICNRKNINISISDSEITYSSDADNRTFDFLRSVNDCTANLVIKDSNLTIPDLMAGTQSFSNLEIYNSIIKNSKKDETLRIASDNWEFHDSEFYGVTGGIEGYLLSTETNGEYYNCYFHNVDNLPCTVMENCNFFNCRKYDSVSGSIGLIRSPGNTRITNSSITAYPSSLGSNSVYLIDFLGLDINHSDRNIELTDCSVEFYSNSSLIDSACNLTIRGSGRYGINTGTIFSERLYRDNTCNLIIEDASITATKGFNVYNSRLTKQAFNELKILDSHINSYGDFKLPLSNNTVIKNSTISSKTECKISYVDTDYLTKPENLEITSSTIHGSSILIGQGVNTVIKDNKITTPADEYTYVTIYLSDNTDVCGLNNRNYEFQGNTIDSNETAISFYTPIENIKLNNNNFSNYTDIYLDRNTTPDLFEFNGNSLNTTREITFSTGDIIDAYYEFSLNELPGGTILNFENTNFSRFYLSSSSASATNKIYLNFKNCVMDRNFRLDTPNLVTLKSPSDSCEALFLDCIFTSDTPFATTDAIFSIDGVNGIIKGSDSNTSIINNEHRNVIEASPSSRVDIQNTVINSHSDRGANSAPSISLFKFCNFDNCIFNITGNEVKSDAVFKYCNLSNSTFDGKEMVTQKNFIYGTNAYAGVCGKQGLTNCTITNVKAESYLFYDWDNGNIDSSEIRSCSGAISIHDDINNSRLFNYNCSEQNIDTISCWGDITDSSIYGWTTKFYGEKIQNTSFNFCINDGRGGAVNIASSSNSEEVLIENCVFSNCKSTEQRDGYAGGGAIAIECYANNIEVTIKNCRFNSNVSAVPNGFDIFMCAKWNDGSSYSGCVLDLQNCYSDYITDYGLLFGNSFSLFTNNITKKGNMQAL